MSSRLLPAPGLWSPWHKAALNLLWPAHCAACDATLDANLADTRFCHDCSTSLSPITSPFCAICCEPFAGAIADDFTCPNCMGQPQHYAFAVAAFMSRGPIRTAIHHFKYGRRIALRLPLASLLLNALNDPRIAIVLGSDRQRLGGRLDIGKIDDAPLRFRDRLLRNDEHVAAL